MGALIPAVIFTFSQSSCDWIIAPQGRLGRGAGFLQGWQLWVPDIGQTQLVDLALIGSLLLFALRLLRCSLLGVSGHFSTTNRLVERQTNVLQPFVELLSVFGNSPEQRIMGDAGDGSPAEFIDKERFAVSCHNDWHPSDVVIRKRIVQGA